MVKVLERERPEWPAIPEGMVYSLFPPAKAYVEDPFYYDQRGLDPFEVYSIWEMNDDDPAAQATKVREKILPEWPSENHRRQMLFSAATKGHVPIVRAILETGVSVYPDLEAEKGEDDASEMGADGSCVPLHSAAHNHHLECVKVFIEEAKVEVDKREDTGRTPLIAAAQSGDLEIVKYLLGQGANPTLRINPSAKIAQDLFGPLAGEDALEACAAKGNVDIARLLLEHPFYGSTRKRKNRPDEEGVWVTPLALKEAARSKNVELLKLFLERGAYPLDDSDGKSKRELLSEEEKDAIDDAIPNAVENGDLESTKLLLSYLYPTVEHSGDTPPFQVPETWERDWIEGIYKSTIHDMPDKFEYLHAFGVRDMGKSFSAYPESMRINLPRLLEVAAGSGSVSCAKLLIEKYGIDPNQLRIPPAMTPLYAAAEHNQAETVRYLLSNFDIDIHLACGRFAAGPTPLFAATRLQNTECVALLLQHGGPVDHIDQELRDLAEPTTAYLVPSPAPARDTVKLLTLANFPDGQDGTADDRKFYVRVQLDPAEDKEWLQKLQIRRSNEELRETGEMARELNAEEKVDDKDDWRNAEEMVEGPTVQEREDWLRRNFTLDVEPGLVPVGTTGREEGE